MMAVIVVHMTWKMVWDAAFDGSMRYFEDHRKGYRERYGAEQGGPKGLVWSIIGTIGERAVCEWRNVTWRPFAFGIIDAGDCEVRATDAHHKRLILHPKDRDHCPFIVARVVPGELPDVTLSGWYWGRDAKREEWWGEANPARPNGRLAYWVPNGVLHGMEELGS